MDELTEKEYIEKDLFDIFFEAKQNNNVLLYGEIYLKIRAYEKTVIDEVIDELLKKEYIQEHQSLDRCYPGKKFREWELKMTESNAQQSVVNNNFQNVNGPVLMSAGDINISNADAESIVKLITNLVAEKKDQSLLTKVSETIKTAGTVTEIIGSLAQLGHLLF